MVIENILPLDLFIIQADVSIIIKNCVYCNRFWYLIIKVIQNIKFNLQLQIFPMKNYGVESD